jgi:hypothetical protein
VLVTGRLEPRGCATTTTTPQTCGRRLLSSPVAADLVGHAVRIRSVSTVWLGQAVDAHAITGQLAGEVPSQGEHAAFGGGVGGEGRRGLARCTRLHSLRRIVEQVIGKRSPSLCHSPLFKPLGMRGSVSQPTFGWRSRSCAGRPGLRLTATRSPQPAGAPSSRRPWTRRSRSCRTCTVSRWRSHRQAAGARDARSAAGADGQRCHHRCAVEQPDQLRATPASPSLHTVLHV